MKERVGFRLLVVAVIAGLVGNMGMAAAQGGPHLSGGEAQAQGGAPTVVSYQGHVLVSGTPYTGTAYCKFAIVDSLGTTTYWSNDGTSSGGSEPTASVTLWASQGLFNVLLGDTTLGGMTQPLSASVFSGADRRLRVWFSSDDSTFALLSPDRRIAAAPYALQAVDADTLDGQHASAFQARVDGACAVGSTIRAVNADGTVVCEAHDARPVFSRTTVDTAGDVGPYTSITIGADGLPVVSYYDNGNRDLKVLHCGNAACSTGNTITAVDTAGEVGSSNSISIGADGLPVVSYLDGSNMDLKVLHCGNVACTAGNTITAVDTAGDAGIYSSITIGADGLPVVSYHHDNNHDLRVLHCGDAACTTGNTITTLDTPGNVGDFDSITIGADGLPVVSYWDYSNGDLKVLHCGNTACTAGNTITAVDTAGDVGWFTSITTGADGLPVVSYLDYTNVDLKVLHCGNAACTSGNTITAVDMAGDVGGYSSITTGADGLPVVSYHDWTNRDLKVLHCGNTACTTGNTLWAVDTAGVVGEYTSITIGADGLPVVSYYDVTNGDLKVLHCSNVFCVPYWRRR